MTLCLFSTDEREQLWHIDDDVELKLNYFYICICNEYDAQRVRVLMFP